VYDDYDGMAIAEQRRHVRTVRVAAVLGTFSILVTLAQLVLGGDLEVVEVAAGVFAVIAVLLGLRAAFQRDWLLNRYRAERLRALKFAYLMGPASWSNDPAVLERARAKLEDEVAQIKSATFDAVDVWLQHIRVLTPPGPSEASFAMELDELRHYYRLKRLGKQGWFFYTSAARNERLNTVTSNLAQYVFFGGIVAALLHFGLMALGSAVGLDLSSETPPPRWNSWVVLSTFFVLAALALPVLSSCIRTIRGSREFARNRMRYYANYLMLVRLDQELRDSKTHEEVLLELYYTEQALEGELHEWLGLMREAEWYG
jgi:hypothetical protein